MSDQPCETPLLELARGVPKDLRGEWETQWFDDGTPCGHAMAPVGKYIHDLADTLEAKDAKIERLRKMISVDTDLLCEKEAEIEKLQAVVDAATTALEKLSRLGNEPHLGNSDGNVIAQRALKEIAALNTGEQEAVAVGTSGTGANAFTGEQDDG